MTQDPTPYDLLQDAAIEGLQDIVTPYYTPPSEVEHSFPIVGQGISSDQYRQTNLGTGNGILHRFPETYYLDTHATAAETNQRNSLILKVTRHNEPGAVAEAIINGFFHRMTEDIEIPMPPVLSPTDVYVTLTYDPREEESETGPISVQTHNGSLPTTHGREHIIIAKPRMRPNQLLSNTPLDRQRQYSSPVVYVPNATTIPRSEDFLYGTTLLMGVNGRGRILHNWSGQEGWNDLLVGDWYYPNLMNGWVNSSTNNRLRIRQTSFGIQFRGRVAQSESSTYNRMAILPNSFTPSGEPRFSVAAWPHTHHHHAQIDEDGSLRILEKSNVAGPNFVNFDGIFLPLD